MLTLVRPAAPVDVAPVGVAPVGVAPVPRGVVLRSPTPADVGALGRLYFAAYDRGGASLTEAEAIEDIRLSFAGEYGPLNLGISRLALARDELAGAVLVVDQAPWPDTPDGPYIIELFTATLWRRRGIARALLTTVLTHTGSVGLRVAEGNDPARRLYESCGFVSWS
jgi:GNAT superfamily N-acetyltransferase